MSVNRWIEKWICCASFDDWAVLDDIDDLTQNPDVMAEECVEYTHDPIVHHISTDHPRVVVVDNCPGSYASVGEDQVAPGIPPMGLCPCGDAGLRSQGPGEITETTIVVGDVDCPVACMDSGCRQGGDYRHASNSSLVRGLARASLGEATSVTGVSSTELSNKEEPAASASVRGLKVPADGPSSVYRVCQDVVEIKHHRRVHRMHRGKYAACVVSEIKNKLGVPRNTDANRLTVRRMAKNIMDRHGVRPTHIRNCIEVVVAGVFIPDEQDLRGAKILASNRAQDLRHDLENAGPKNAWQRAIDRMWGRSSYSHHARGGAGRAVLP